MDLTRASSPRRVLLRACHIVLGLFCVAPVRAQEAAPKTAPPPAAQGAIGKATLADKPIAVLGGRLTVRMPKSAKVAARPFPITGAPESEEQETRVMFDSGDERLVLMAHESFAFAGDDFEKDVKDWVAKWKGKYQIAPYPLAGRGLKAVALTPIAEPDHTRSDDATFVAGIFVVSADRTIQTLDVYVNAVGEKDLKGCRTLAHQILRSAAPGPRRLQLAAGERRLFVFSKDVEASIQVPKNVLITRQNGPDFLVYRLIALSRLGSESGSLLLYVGWHPDYEPGAKKGEASIFGKKVEWHADARGEGLQTLCDLDIPSEDHLRAHIIITAPDDAQLKSFRASVETLKLVKPTARPVK